MPTRKRRSANAKVLQFKKAIAAGLKQGMQRRNITIADLVRQTGAGRESIRRILNPRDPAITLKTIAKTADVLGLRLTLVPDDTHEFMHEAASQMGALLDAEEAAQVTQTTA